MKTKLLGIILLFLLINIVSISAAVRKKSSSRNAVAKKNGTRTTVIRKSSPRNNIVVQFINLRGGTHEGVYGTYNGVQLGFQLGDEFYLGITTTRFYPISKEGWGRNDRDDGVYGQREEKVVKAQIGEREHVEIRYIPFSFGLYFAAGIIRQQKDYIRMEFSERNRVVGNKTYKTGLESRITYIAREVPFVGSGIQYIFNNGFVLGIGLQLEAGEKQKPEIELNATNKSVSGKDMKLWEERVEEEKRGYPFAAFFNIGYAF
jgi:hypothetical protein